MQSNKCIEIILKLSREFLQSKVSECNNLRLRSEDSTQQQMSSLNLLVIIDQA